MLALQLLTGNTDTTTPVYRPLEPPIVASKIRFVPFSIYARTMCMRVELYGCDNKRKNRSHLRVSPPRGGEARFFTRGNGALLDPTRLNGAQSIDETYMGTIPNVNWYPEGQEDALQQRVFAISITRPGSIATHARTCLVDKFFVFAVF